jgi:MFS family permease
MAYSREPETDRSLRHSVRDGIAYSVMSGGGETYFSAFALFLKASTTQIGLLASLPPLLGSFAQLLSAWLGHLTGRRKPIILLGAGLQTALWLPLLVLPLLFPTYAVPILIISVILYFASANLAAPQWTSLMGDLVPERRRGRFFGMRNRLASGTAFGALVAAGVVLHGFDRAGQTLNGFIAIFAVAMLARAVSVYHLTRMVDPGGRTAAAEIPVKRSLFERMRHSPFARFSLFYALMQAAVAIASPFFTVYMLRDLHYTYLEFMANTAASVLMQVITLNAWGRISDSFGNRAILRTTGMIIPFLPSLWLVSTEFWYLIAVQIVGGLMWAGFSLSAGNFFYDLVPAGKRATWLAVHNVGASLGVFVGATVGGYLGATLPKSFTIGTMPVEWTSVLYGVFLFSTVCRLAVVSVFLPRLKEVREVRPLSMSGLVFRIARYNALAGLVFDVMGRRKPRKTA